MYFLDILMIAIANNIDNISVRIAYSIRGIKISIIKNLWISVITFIISSMAALGGTFISKFLDKDILSVISMVILTLMGMWIMLTPFAKEVSSFKEVDLTEGKFYKVLTNPEAADVDNSKDIDFKEATFLGIAISIDSIGGGLSAGMIGLNFIFMGLFSAVVSFFAILLGNYIAILFQRFGLNKKASVLAGLILIILGIKQIFK